MKPLCFVLMPFGKKAVPSGLTVDFDAVYASVIQPGVEAAGMEPLRADEELTGGVIWLPMYERLIRDSRWRISPAPMPTCSTNWACVTACGRPPR